MTEQQITLEQALELVDFEQALDGTSWRVKGVLGTVWGNVKGDVIGYVQGDVRGNVEGDVIGYVLGNVWGSVEGDVFGNVKGDVGGTVIGTINNHEWQFIETRKGRFRRMLEKTGDQQLIDEFNQLMEEES